MPQNISPYLGSYAPIFKVLEEAGLGDRYTLIGGQAVSYWDRRYHASETEIASKDLDLRADEGICQKLSGFFHGSYHVKDPNSAAESSCWMSLCQVAPGKEHQIDILERLRGSDFGPHHRPMGIALRMPFDDPPVISILDPCSLMMIKLSAWRDRGGSHTFNNDEKHLNALVKIVPAFLSEATASYEQGAITENPGILAQRLMDTLDDNPPVPASLQPQLPALRKAINEFANCTFEERIEQLSSAQLGKLRANLAERFEVCPSEILGGELASIATLEKQRKAAGFTH